MDSIAKDIILFLLGVVVAGLAWWHKELWASHKELSKSHKELSHELSEVVKTLPVNFASKTDVRDIENRMSASLIRVETSVISRVDDLGSDLKGWLKDLGNKIDSKADKK